MYSIIKRHKNSSGAILGYTLREDSTGREFFSDKEMTVNIANAITNAKFVGNLDFRANKGSHIETVIEYSDLPALKKKEKIKHSGNLALDYYGKDNIKLCRIIRDCALSGNFVIDEESHERNGGRNTYLFDLIKACNIDLKTFLAGYLCCVHPFLLRRVTKDVPNSDVWFLELGYKTKLYIKFRYLTYSNTPTIVLSFHESNFGGFTLHGGL